MFVRDAELVIGIVGRMGVDTKTVCGWVSEALHVLRYHSKYIKITDYFQVQKIPDVDLSDETVEDRYNSYIIACNSMREKSERNDFFASFAIRSIIDARKEITGDKSGRTPARRTAYVIDQLKRPEEVESLRAVYGQQFILISCHMPAAIRKYTLARKIAEQHSSAPKAAEWQEAAAKLISRDEMEAGIRFGQRVSDVFPKADVIIDAHQEHHAERTLRRFFQALFGNFHVSPTRGEFLQNIAFNVSLTSCDTARQVGAVISRDGEILATGFNEAPKAYGGTYWPDEGEDARDVTIGRDVNTVRKRQMVADIVRRLRDNQFLRNSEIPDYEIESRFIDADNAPLKKSQIMDTLEYGRAVHAEMAALSTAARNGISISAAQLFCTTFPCHNCAKHIVASGVHTVYYLEPYSKSFTDELYPDSISIDEPELRCDAVNFRQFVGITPSRFRELFAKSKLKNDRGKVREWNPEESQPLLGRFEQAHPEKEVMFQEGMRDNLSPDLARYFGFDAD